jgi:hypothetical protein
VFTHCKKNIVTAAYHNTNKLIVFGNTRVKVEFVRLLVGFERRDLPTIRIFRLLRNELDSPAFSALGVRSRKLSNILNGQSWDG